MWTIAFSSLALLRSNYSNELIELRTMVPSTSSKTSCEVRPMRRNRLGAEPYAPALIFPSSDPTFSQVSSVASRVATACLNSFRFRPPPVEQRNSFRQSALGRMQVAATVNIPGAWRSLTGCRNVRSACRMNREPTPRLPSPAGNPPGIGPPPRIPALAANGAKVRNLPASAYCRTLDGQWDGLSSGPPIQISTSRSPRGSRFAHDEVCRHDDAGTR